MFAADIISTVEFNYSGDLLATGDKGGRVVIFQREPEVSAIQSNKQVVIKSSLQAFLFKEPGSHLYNSLSDTQGHMHAFFFFACK